MSMEKNKCLCCEHDPNDGLKCNVCDCEVEKKA